ncbi:sugar-binding protein [Pseudomonas putida]|uniref:RHS repeat-associated core domain-containing protein n=1 Tax=Pseudomonas putida TaxID=303 RepID=UPI00105A9DC9|nr:RHS repeat-associated core domain-containing protein [Pseudomonas putida]TDJ73313.1 sugar-binding protein [Pseudomonas putida]
MAIQSNAFNFRSFTQGSVDPRTGLYTLGLTLPQLNANDNIGPDFPVQLSFNPLKSENVGFGLGWQLNLSTFSIRDGMLDLHTGESQYIADNGPGQPGLAPERKLDSFHFKNISEGGSKRYRVAHAAGLVEVLEPQLGDPDTALPTRIQMPSGHGINLVYDRVNGQPRLKSIHDDSKRMLLNIDYRGNQEVWIELQPGTSSVARYTLKFEGEELRWIVLPSKDEPRWTLNYKTLGSFRLLERMENPTGGVERVVYKETGHAFPGIARHLPYVREHVIQPDPLDEKSHMRTTYDYSTNNFLGYGADGVVWDDNYHQDHLYKFTGREFSYYSTASHYRDGKVLRTVKTIFNRFHLTTQCITTQGDCVETVTTEYHERANLRFEDQPAYFQLPKKITTSWTQNRQRREQSVSTEYDAFGNVVEETQASGVRTVSEYYPSTQSEGCPADPEGFVRNLKSVTIYPAKSDSITGSPAQIVRTQFTYKALPLLSLASTSADADTWLAAFTEDTFQIEDEEDEEQEILLQSIEHAYLNQPSNPLLHGRNDRELYTLQGHTTRTSWHYKRVPDEHEQPPLLSIKKTVAASGGTLERSNTSIFSILNGQLVESEDVNGVVTRYSYDVLGRLVTETVAPDDPQYMTSRTFAYGEFREDNHPRSYEQVTDAKGVTARTIYDGYQRPIRQELERDAAETNERTIRITSTQEYDSIGLLVGEIDYDYLPDPSGNKWAEERTLSMASRYDYDDWGSRCKTIRPDGVEEFNHRSPFGEGGIIVTSWIEAPDQRGIQRQLNITQYNAFDKPAFTYRRNSASDETDIGRIDYQYDGLGRCVSNTSTFRGPDNVPITRTSQFTYDVWDRMCEQVRPDGSALLRTFAAHSTAELTTDLQLRARSNGEISTICARTFDGLERLTSVTVGPRKETLVYKGTTELVQTRTVINTEEHRPGKRRRVFTYSYKPQLTLKPTTIDSSVEVEEDAQTAANEQASFDYDRHTANLSSATNHAGNMSYTYTDQGFVDCESWAASQGHGYSIQNSYSWRGRPLSRTPSDASARIHSYDNQGRVNGIAQGPLSATLAYNSQGLLCSTTTEDADNPDRSVCCEQEYDNLGREVRRTLAVNGENDQELLHVWRDDDVLLSRKLWRAGSLVREEIFGYDELGRLESYDCTGDLQARPCNAKGRPITSQIFRFDDVDNITRCITDFADGKSDSARFTYAEDGSFQLSKVTHTLTEDYPAEQTFAYDEQGNMLNDEQGRQLRYDVAGRLHQVLDHSSQPLVEYLYDGHDRLQASAYGGSLVQRRYQDQRLDCTVQDGLVTQYLYTNECAVGVCQPGGQSLLLTDHAGSIVTEVNDAGTHHAAYSAYGERADDNDLSSLLAFNGEVREQTSGWYMLGNGYRAYNPGLMRFHSPDSLSPEASGINPYVYVLGNPVNWRDPSGHRAQAPNLDRSIVYTGNSEKRSSSNWFSWAMLALNSVMVVVAAVGAPWALPMTVKGAVALVSLMGQVTGLAMEVGGKLTKNSTLEYVGAFVSLVFGVVSLGAGAALRKSAGARMAQPGSRAGSLNGDLVWALTPEHRFIPRARILTPPQVSRQSSIRSLASGSADAAGDVQQVASNSSSIVPANTPTRGSITPPASQASGSLPGSDIYDDVSHHIYETVPTPPPSTPPQTRLATSGTAADKYQWRKNPYTGGNEVVSNIPRSGT